MFKPAFDGQKCSLGFQVVEWLEEYACHGPGDVEGEPLDFRRDPEFERFIIDAYEVHPATGRRVKQKAVVSAPKGRAKSELAGLIGVAEALAPVRCDGFDAEGQPVGRPVRSPFIRCLATEEKQSGNTFQNIAFIMGEWGQDTHPEIYGGIKGIGDYRSAMNVYLRDGGECRASSAGAASKDGGKETFVVPDEALSLDTPLPTPEGWTTMGHVAAGDLLIGSDGQPVRVLTVTDVMTDRDCYRVTFADGSAVVASAGHQWLTRVAASSAKPRVRTTAEMAADGRRFRIPMTRSLDAPPARLSVDPYVLGAWLGDGDASNATIASGHEDTAEMVGIIEARGYTVKLAKTSPDAANILYVSVAGSHSNRFSPVRGLKVTLRDEGLLHNKHIPAKHMRASAEQRLELIRGLMDTDGHADKAGNCTFVQTREGLVDQFVELLRSLGQECRKVWCPDDRSSAGGWWKVHFTPRWGMVPFRLARKAERVRGHARGPGWRTVASIERVDRVPVRCVGVDAADHLFVAGNAWAVTHNCHLYVLPELRGMYATVMRNLPKRKAAEPWALLTTTACKLGEQSVWETLEAEWKAGRLGPEWLVFHHEAKGRIDIMDDERTLRQLRAVYGPAMHPVTGWMDPARTLLTMRDPTECRDEAEAARYYLNRSMPGDDAWIAKKAVELAQVGPPATSDTTGDVLAVVPAGEPISIGFDGSLNDDSTVIRGCRMSDGFRFTIGLWEKPEGASGVGWQVPRRDVLDRLRWALRTYRVSRANCDPHEWRTDIEAVADEFNVDPEWEVVVQWATSRDTQMAYALDRLKVDILQGVTQQSNDAAALTHYGNTYKRMSRGKELVRKEYPKSPRKIDIVPADALAYEGRAAALANGWTAKPVRHQLIHFR